ncbi:MAG TPA: branched-chain amino acid ABC transporter permease [Actinomycetota bacterium]|nr:branched-chain amino acid ABC transporter permease [Actinomycetota bacterium]
MRVPFAGATSRASVLLALLGAALAPLFMSIAAEEVLVNVAVLCLLALGLNVVVGLAGLLDLGYIAFYATGAYCWAILSGAGPIKFGFTQTEFWSEWGFWLILLLAIFINMLIGVSLGSPTLRLRGDYLAIVTLGFGEIVRIIANNWDPVTRGAQGIQGIPHPKVPVIRYDFGLDPSHYYYLLLLLIVVVMVVIRNLESSRIGRAWLAIREDEVAAEAMGVPTLKMKLLAFAFGAATAGFAGVVISAKTNYISPAGFDVLSSFFILVAVVLGGMGSIWGSLIGALIIAGVPGWVQLRFVQLDEYRFLIFGALLVLMMIFRPQGVLPAGWRPVGVAASPEEAGATEEAMGIPQS